MKKYPKPGAHDRARDLRVNMTDVERERWEILRSRQLGGHKFRRQVPIGPLSLTSHLILRES
jgi:very-short-patch-repair endonuclease